MPMPAYMTIKGKVQKDISNQACTLDSVGNGDQKAHENEIMVQAFEHQVFIPRDPQSGQPTGERVHSPLIITKVFDRSSPLLFTALTTGEVMTECCLQFYRNSSTGAEAYFKIVLEDAVIVDIRSRMPHCLDDSMAKLTHLEDVHFSYKKITWEHQKSTTMGYDDWSKPRIA